MNFKIEPLPAVIRRLHCSIRLGQSGLGARPAMLQSSLDCIIPQGHGSAGYIQTLPIQPEHPLW
jgi:hypothetical protein